MNGGEREAQNYRFIRSTVGKADSFDAVTQRRTGCRNSVMASHVHSEKSGENKERNKNQYREKMEQLSFFPQVFSYHATFLLYCIMRSSRIQ